MHRLIQIRQCIICISNNTKIHANIDTSIHIHVHIYIYLCMCLSIYIPIFIFFLSFFLSLFFSIWVFFREHSRFTGLQGKGEGISLTPHYHFHLLQGHLDVSMTIPAGSSHLRIASSRTRTGNLWFLNASR